MKGPAWSKQRAGRPSGPGTLRRAVPDADPVAPAGAEAIPGLVSGPGRVPGRSDRAGEEPATARRPDHPWGLPPALRRGIESLSGLAMDDVRVHRNSNRPAALSALAFAEGSDIYLGPGQDVHLPHEAWHVVQQKQGRAQTGVQATGTHLIDENPALEREADVMGDRARSHGADSEASAGLVDAAPSTAIQLMKVGVEITFSNPYLARMALTEKAYKQACAQQGLDPVEDFADYTDAIRKKYVRPWVAHAKEAAGKAPKPVSVKDGESPKGARHDLNKVLNYAFEPGPDRPTPVDESKAHTVEPGPAIAPTVGSGPLVSVVATTDQPSDVPVNPMKQESGDVVVPAPTIPPAPAPELPGRWWWDIDIDPACLEIRAEPIDHTLYSHPVIRSIIDEHIYGGAKKLGLKTGYAGLGGGHLSVDLATGFDGDPLNVIKTMAWIELNKNIIDENVALIDVIDNKNAPYLFHTGRGKTGLDVLRQWLLASLTEPARRSAVRAPAPAPAPEQPAPAQGGKKREKAPKKLSVRERAEQAELARQNDLRGVPWNDHLAALGRLLAKYLAVTTAKNDDGQNPGMFAELDDFEKLHYLAVNLQHTRTADRTPDPDNDKTLKESARRVEFRRLVSQRNVDELTTMIKAVVGWVEQAKAVLPEVLAKELGACQMELLAQSAEFIAESKKKARKVENRDHEEQ